jgi:hypothetical protein
MLNEEVLIKSTDSAATLVLSDKLGDYFTASYQSPDLCASATIWGDYTECKALVNLFESIAKDWQGWEGERAWVLKGNLVFPALRTEKAM